MVRWWLVAVALASVVAAEASGSWVSREVEIAPEVSTDASAPAALAFEGLELPSNRSLIVRVFANLPEGATDISPKSPHYLGYFAVEAAQETDRTARRTVKPIVRLRKRVPFGEPLRVTLVPVDGRGRPIKDVTLKIGRVVLIGDRQP